MVLHIACKRYDIATTRQDHTPTGPRRKAPEKDGAGWDGYRESREKRKCSPEKDARRALAGMNLENGIKAGRVDGVKAARAIVNC